MGILHEAMEMDPPFAPHIGSRKEQIHQHRLAAADLANQIQPVRPGFVRPLNRLAPQPPGQQAGCCARADGWLIATQLQPQALQALSGQGLRRVGCQFTLGNPGAIGGQRSCGEGRILCRCIHNMRQ